MSWPEVDPEKTVSGIAVDPKTLERVIPETRRADGSVRKQLKVRPGFTPQEDVSIFRGTRQQQMDRNSLPKGHIIGWVPPSSATKSKPGASASASESGDKPLTKSAVKNAKRKAKKQAEKEKVILANWDDDDEVDVPKKPAKKGKDDRPGDKDHVDDLVTEGLYKQGDGDDGKQDAGAESSEPASTGQDDDVDKAEAAIVEQFQQLDVR